MLETDIKRVYVHLVSLWRIQMESNKRLEKRMENSSAYVGHPSRGQTIFVRIGRNVRLKIELIWIYDIDNRNNAEEEDL
jgi:hypothetical protein